MVAAYDVLGRKCWPMAMKEVMENIRAGLGEQRSSYLPRDLLYQLNAPTTTNVREALAEMLSWDESQYAGGRRPCRSQNSQGNRQHERW
jgi:hypothetical protein